ncbi:MAG: DNA recombination protein RmuC [Patescibacteria group bacterium]
MDTKKIRKNVSLKEFTTFRIGGKAKYFFEAETKQDLISVILDAKAKKLAFFVLGGGSKILISDEGFDGLVVKPSFSNIEFKRMVVNVGAGAPLALLVSESTRRGLSGLEWAYGIPGTIGGAVSGNSGAFGRAMKDLIEYAFREKHVIIVSPTSFYAYLQTVLQGLKALQIEKSTEKIIKRIERLNKHLVNYDSFLKKLGNNLSTTVGAYNQAYKEFGKIDKDIAKLTTKEKTVEPLQLEKPNHSE